MVQYMEIHEKLQKTSMKCILGHKIQDFSRFDPIFIWENIKEMTEIGETRPYSNANISRTGEDIDIP